MHSIAQRVTALLASTVLGLTLGGTQGAAAVPEPSAVGIAIPTVVPDVIPHDAIVSESSTNWTPQIRDGRVFDIAQTGQSVVAGGRFAEIAGSNGSPVLSRSSIVSFNATSGAINTGFDPSIVGDVRAVEPGPTPGTVYVGGTFQGIDGVTGKLFLLDAQTGARVSSFTPVRTNGAVQDVVLRDGRLFVGGSFTSVNNQPRGGLVTMNPTTGAVDGFMTATVAGNHNWFPGSSGAKAPVGPKSLTIDPEGQHLAVMGNFTTVDGSPRDQLALMDISGETAALRTDWRARGYEARCASGAFDSYVRDVHFSPDSEYFSVATTGGPFPGTLCDTLTRFDPEATGDDIRPEWIDETGGDTLLSVASSGAAVYTGGHQRWMNNLNGRDNPNPGAVPRPGIGAVDPGNGVLIDWNPGRNPRGAGAEALLATDQGLWVGHDTNWIGDRDDWRPGIAFFPLSGGYELGAGESGSLPSNVYRAETGAGDGADALFRVNAGGPAIPAFDGGPSWRADTDSASDVRNSGSNAAAYGAVPTVTPNVPASAPRALYESERWDPNGDPEMTWAIPIPAGEDISVRLYLANRCTCTNDPGERRFDVQLEGTTVLDDYDISADVGHDVGTMKSFDITSDGTVDIAFGHVTENPLINGIEIVRRGGGAEPPADDTGLSYLYFEGDESPFPAQPAPAGDIDWQQVRGATMIDGDLFYGMADGSFVRRTFDGTDYGDPVLIDPYNDPDWVDVDTGSGQTFRGNRPNFYAQIPSLTGMTYDDGRLYYTRAGSNQLYYRSFSPDSGVIYPAERTVSGFSAPSPSGIFVDQESGSLYFATAETGNLSRIDLDGTSVSGTSEVVSGPEVDGVNWAFRAVFPGPGDPPPAPNVDPVASFDSTSTSLTASFDASGSSDSDGEIVSYGWDFGDGGTAEGVEAEHTYDEAGTYQVSLTVTDDEGATDITTQEVTVVFENESPMADFIFDSTGLDASFDATGSSDPDGVIVAYQWDFGDGESGTGDTVEHTYAEAGTYTVSLTVTDDNDATNLVAQDVTVSLANVEPNAALSVEATGLMIAVDGSGSTDSDGEIVSHDWDFGDGGTGTGVTTEHTYAEDGTYTVTLTVTDDDGATGTATEEVTVEAANASPSASLTADSAGLDLAVDASGSSDPDGEVVSYEWDFGDGGSATGVTAEHSYAESGTYTVTLTVTDDEGAQGTATQEVTVSDAPVSAPAFVTSAAVQTHGNTSSMRVPAGVEEGDLLLLHVVMSKDRDPAPPTGIGEWEVLTRLDNGPQNVVVYSRVATGAESDELFTLDVTDWTKTDMTMSVYRGVGADPIEAMADVALVNQTQHPSAEVEVAGPGRTVVTYWSDRSSSTTAWQAPSGVEVRSTQVGAGGGRVSSLLVDDTSGPGTYPSLVATSTPQSPRSMVVTLVLAPGDSPPPANVAPSAAFTLPPCDQLMCAVDASGSSDPDGEVVSYEWDFGDGGSATGVTAEHSYAESGTYTVTLTVTDDEGAQGTATQEVTVSDAPVSAPAFVTSAAVQTHGNTSSMRVPAGVEEGDLLLLHVVMSKDRDPAPPTGIGEWEVLTRLDNGPQNVVVYSRVATGAESDELITLDVTDWTKTDMTMSVYRGVGADPIEAMADVALVNQTQHPSAEVEVAGPGRTVVTYWSDRSSSTTAWQAPSGVEVRSTQVGAGGGRVSSLLVDDTSGPGTYPSLVATSTPQSPRSMVVTLVLAPDEA